MGAEETPSATARLSVSFTCMEEVDLLPHLDGTERGVVVMMCGLSGSGKSTYAKALEGRGYTRLSIDEVVWARIGRDAADLDPAEYERLKSAIEQELWGELIRLMEAKLPVVIDYSFWSRATRDRYKAAIETHGCRWELIHLKTDLETLRRRLASRNQRNDANSVTVSDELLERYFANFEEPTGEGERVIVQEQFPGP
ncbi:AAA family ATPase [Kitasatospora sp. NPDC101235]|uniref:AAA family ATPase n=1 Tax=Kitasatospora sp. NPDC101235 TaxID=3364101 RepID=UPI003806116D